MKPLLCTLAAAAVLSAFPAYAADVGRVIMATGDTFAVRSNQTVALTPGSAVQEGDLLRTGAGSTMQVRFVDESILSLRAASELRVDEFKFSGQEDGSERALFRLLKGGLRTITGLVGRTNHQNYALRSSVSTIGIRGTDFATTLCQQDCTNPDGSLAKDGQYGRVMGQSNGTNRIDVNGERDQKTLGISQNFFLSDAKSQIELLLVPPAFVGSAPPATPAKKPAGGTGGEQTAGGGATQDSRSTTTAPTYTALNFVAPESTSGGGSTSSPPAGASAVPSSGGTPTLVGLVAFESQSDPLGGGGGAFLTDANLTFLPNSSGRTVLQAFTVPPGTTMDSSPNVVTITGSTTAASVIDETLVGNSLNAHWGRWVVGSINDENGVTTFNSTRQFHYLSGPLTPYEVVAAKTGSFVMNMVGGTTPTNQLGQSASSFNTSVSVNYTGRTVTFGATSFTFPSDNWSFPSSGPLPIMRGNVGAYVQQDGAVGTCSGSTCLTSTPAALSRTGSFMGPAGDHLGASFQARTTSGPNASAQTVKIFTCSPSC